VRASGCSRVGVTHGRADTFARYAREELGLEAFALSTRYTGESIDEPAGDNAASEVAEPAGEGTGA